MGTPSSKYESIVRRLIHEQPAGIQIGQIYSAVTSEVVFDEDDLRSPTHNGVSTNEPSWKRNVRNTLQGLKGKGEIVNAVRELWRAPTPRLDTSLSIAEAWQEVTEAARSALATREVWASIKDLQPYFVSNVSEDRITIDRPNGGQPVELLRGEVERGIGYVNAAGGRLGRRTLHYTVAKEVAVVMFHPLLRWDETGEWIDAVGGTFNRINESTTKREELPDDDPRATTNYKRKTRKVQAKFRERLLEVYGHKCCVSGTGPDEVLDAAHIEPHWVAGSNNSRNGLLLRADLHCLFDANLLRVDPDTFQIDVDERIRESYYGSFHGVALRDRLDCLSPNIDLLRERWLAPKGFQPRS